MAQTAIDATPFPVEIVTPEGTVFNGEASMVSTRTEYGEVGIMAHHAPLMAMLRPTTLRLHREGKIEKFAQSEGYLQVYGNRAIVLVQGCFRPEELDADLLRRRLADAEKLHEASEQGTAEHDRSHADIQRWRAYLDLLEEEEGQA